MAVQLPNFQSISFDEANPFLTGMNKGQMAMQNFLKFPQDLQAQILANEIQKVNAKYAEPMAQGNLTKLNQENQWNPKIWQSEIGLRGAQQTNLGAETNKINYMLQHPGFMGGDETKSLEALKAMGLVDNNYRAVQQPGQTGQSGMNPQQPNQPMSPEDQQAEQVKQYAHAQDVANSIVRQQRDMGLPPSQTMSTSQMPGGNNAQGFDVNALVSALVNKPMTDMQYKQTLNQVMQQNLAGKAYTSMPTVEKEYSISQARAFGYTGEQASNLFNQGYDLSALAKAKGYDPTDTSSWPIARGAPTTAIQTRIQRANSTLSALQAVEPSLAAAYAPYAQRFNGVSPKLVRNMIMGENQDQQAEAFAAYALYPEIQALRINAQGGNVGEGAIQSMADASFARLNTLGLTPNSYVYQKAMKRVNQYIKQMNRAENAAIYKQTNDSYDEDDKSTASSNSDLSGMSDAELQKIAGGF